MKIFEKYFFCCQRELDRRRPDPLLALAVAAGAARRGPRPAAAAAPPALLRADRALAQYRCRSVSGRPETAASDAFY